MANYLISNMNCGGCVRGVTSAIRGLDDQAAVTADLPTKTVNVESRVEPIAIVNALKAAGFEASATA